MPARRASGHELVGGLELGGAIGPELTGIFVKAGIGLVDVDELRSLLKDAARGLGGGGGQVADAIWLNDKINNKPGGGATAYTTIPLGGPHDGRYWEITNIVVLVDSPIGTVANAVPYLCAGSPDNPVITDVRVVAQTHVLPWSQQMGKDSCIVGAGQKAYVQVYGVDATHQLIAMINGWDLPIWADSKKSVSGRLGVEPDSLLRHKPGPRDSDPHYDRTGEAGYDPPTFASHPLTDG